MGSKDFFSGNLLGHLPLEVLPQELCDCVLESGGVRVERIVSTGQSSPPGFWFDQPEDEWVLVLQGEGVLAFDDGRSVVLLAGDHYFLPAHCRHRVEQTSSHPPCVWLAVFMGSGF